MKVLYIIDRLNEGAGRVLYQLAKHFQDSVIISMHREGNLLEEFEKLPNKIYYSADNIRSIRKIIKKEKPRIIHTHNVDAYEYGIPAAFLTGKPVVHTAHGRTVKKTKLKRLAEKIYHKTLSISTTKYIAVSQNLADYVKKNWSIKKPKIIYNGIDTDQFLPRTKPNKNKIGIIAGLRPVKDHVTLLKAMQDVKATLYVIGDGPEKDKLKRLAKKINLKNIKFLGNKKDMVKVYNSLDIGILCSINECLSMVLLEGMSTELPFIATKVGGNPEIILDNYNGIIIPKKDPKELAKNINFLLKNPKIRQKLGIQARQTIIKRFNINKFLEKHEKLYRSIIMP